MKNEASTIGVYETMRTFNGVFALLPEHQERLEGSCETMGLDCPDLAELVRPFEGRRDVRLRVAVTKDGVEVSDSELPDWSGSFLNPEVWQVKLYEGERSRSGIKTTDTAMQLAARDEAEEEGYGEILLVDEKGRITEGGITNVYFVEGAGASGESRNGGEKIVTPGEGMLPGITRDLILRACEELGVEVELRDVYEEELDDFEAVFLSNAVRGMVATSDEPLPTVVQNIIDWCTKFIRVRIIY